ncbi:MAG TPA: SOS response-associated peptidase [Cytophagaceae bacterium]
MCGRYSLVKSEEEICKRYNLKQTVAFQPRYNVAPGQFMPVITNSNPGELSIFRWGLVPNWADAENIGLNQFNAKVETILTKAQFKQNVKTNRCLVVADGFYEWKRVGKNKVPYRITMTSDKIFAMAGIWDSWENKKGEILNTFAIITTSANEAAREIYERMPVILNEESSKLWISQDLSEQELGKLLLPSPSKEISYYKSHRAINNASLDDPDCIKPAPALYPGETYSLFDF